MQLVSYFHRGVLVQLREIVESDNKKLRVLVAAEWTPKDIQVSLAHRAKPQGLTALTPIQMRVRPQQDDQQ